MIFLFNSIQYGVLPRLMLLDEPDAHLHPSLTKQFIQSIQDVLVKKFGVQVIMTTHSPSTIALSPEGNIYELKKNPTSIEKLGSKSQGINILTSGFISVTEGAKFVLVEDQSDVYFYS